MLLLGYVTGNGCIVMERRIWYNYLNVAIKSRIEKLTETVLEDY